MELVPLLAARLSSAAMSCSYCYLGIISGAQLLKNSLRLLHPIVDKTKTYCVQ